VNEWLVILAAGLGSYALRLSMIMSDRVRLPARLEASAGMVAPAAFAALAMTSLGGAVVSAGVAPVSLAVPLAVAAAAVGAARTGRPYVAMLAGMPTYWLAAALLPA
jgi:branched-subunit amino acid transport protein